MARRLNLIVPGFTEPDLRSEMEHLLDGSFPEISKKQIGLLRKMRTPLSANKCSCVNPITLESDKDHYCPYCMGEGQYWDEEFIDIYRVVKQSDVGLSDQHQPMRAGDVTVPLVVFYIRASIELSKNDRIIEMELDMDGELIRPYRRRGIYKISTLGDMRLDNGRLEYWKAACSNMNYRFLNGPINE